MPRDLPLSNGRLLVAFGRDYLIRDIYYPHVGKENHATGHPFRFGVWTEGEFSWIGSDWQLDRRYAVDSMVTEVRARHEVLGIALLFHDAVDFYENVLVRHIGVTNLQDRAREIRLFFHHDFHIRGYEVGDTALYSPETQALIHYKDDRYFLMNCAVGGDIGVRRYACGTKEVAGAEGTWRDAEDGELQGNPIAQGSVDSTLGLSLTVPARGSAGADYWMAAGRDFREVATIDKVVREKSPGELLRRTRNYWRLWVHKDQRGLDGLPELVVQRYNQSLLIIRSQIDHDGAITAANDTDIIGFARDTYSYMWPRDGALVAAALMRAGHVGAPEKFLQFCSHVISPLGYVRHKYNPDGTLASSWHGYVRDGKPVLPIQEDETALIIWALWQYFELYQRIEETAPFYRTLVTRPADFMPGYVAPATGLPPPSPALVEERLWVHTDVGGLARFENDAYHQVERQDTKRVPGNPWFISTLWLARYRLLRSHTVEDLARGLELIEWAARRALPSGVMAEQLHPYTGEPLSVSPLTWSHAAYVRVVREYLDRTAQLNRCPTCGHETGRTARLTDRLTAITEPHEFERQP